MKKTFKAVIAMILVLALGFAVAAPVFAASASPSVVQPASIRDFFKKIGDSIKKVVSKILDSIKIGSQPNPEETTAAPVTNPGGGSSTIEPEDIPVDDSEQKGSAVGGNDIYASPLR